VARPVHTGPLQASMDGGSSSRVSYQLGPRPAASRDTQWQAGLPHQHVTDAVAASVTLVSCRLEERL